MEMEVDRVFLVYWQVEDTPGAQMSMEPVVRQVMDMAVDQDLVTMIAIQGIVNIHMQRVEAVVTVVTAAELLQVTGIATVVEAGQGVIYGWMELLAVAVAAVTQAIMEHLAVLEEAVLEEAVGTAAAGGRDGDRLGP